MNAAPTPMLVTHTHALLQVLALNAHSDSDRYLMTYSDRPKDTQTQRLDRECNYTLGKTHYFFCMSKSQL